MHNAGGHTSYIAMKSAIISTIISYINYFEAVPDSTLHPLTMAIEYEPMQDLVTGDYVDYECRTMVEGRVQESTGSNFGNIARRVERVPVAFSEEKMRTWRERAEEAMPRTAPRPVHVIQRPPVTQPRLPPSARLQPPVQQQPTRPRLPPPVRLDAPVQQQQQRQQQQQQPSTSGYTAPPPARLDAPGEQQQRQRQAPSISGSSGSPAQQQLKRPATPTTPRTSRTVFRGSFPGASLGGIGQPRSATLRADQGGLHRPVLRQTVPRGALSGMRQCPPPVGSSQPDQPNQAGQSNQP